MTDETNDDVVDGRRFEGGIETESSEPDERVRDLSIATNIIAGEYARGQIVSIRGLTLERCGTDGNLWALYNESEELVDVVQAGHAQSAKKFLKFIDDSLNEDESRWSL